MNSAFAKKSALCYNSSYAKDIVIHRNVEVTFYEI